MDASHAQRNPTTTCLRPQRRRLLGALGAGALAAWATPQPSPARRAPDASRFVFVILRGGIDGLGAVPAIGDPDFAAARGPLAQFGAPAARARRDLRAASATSRSCTRCTGAATRRSCTRSACRTATARTSMRSRCSRAAARGRTSSHRLARARARDQRRQGHRAEHRRCRSCCAAAPRSTPGRRRRCPIRRPTWSPGSSGCTPATRRSRPRSSARSALHFDAPAPMQDDGDRRDERGMNGRRATARVRRRSPQRAAEFLAQPTGPQAAVLEIGGWDTHANQANPERRAREQPAPARRRPRARCATACRRRHVGAHRRRRRDRVRPRGRGQRHARHRPRHRRRGLRARRRGARRARASPTGRASRSAIASRAATCAPRPTCARC